MSARHRNNAIWLELVAAVLSSFLLAVGYRANQRLFHQVLPYMITAPAHDTNRLPITSGRQNKQNAQMETAARLQRHA